MGPRVASSGVTFRYRDDRATVKGVSLVQEVAWPRTGPTLDSTGEGRWEVDFDRPPVDRMEYRFEVAHADGGQELLLDPANRLLAPGAFGERSVVEFPEYAPPRWLGSATVPGQAHEVELFSKTLAAGQPGVLWSAAGTPAELELPLLVALDGLEFARFSGLLKMLDALVAEGSLPPMRALLLHPVSRENDYTASPEYAHALAREIIPKAAEIVGIKSGRRSRVGLGASLGGLAMLHAHREEPDAFGALFLQSSSFLHSGLLGQGPLRRVKRFVNDVLAARFWRSPIPIVMTCGTVEQNLSNNRDTVAVLCEQGYPASLHVVRDAHNWIAWRDAWTPHLVDLLSEVWDEV